MLVGASQTDITPELPFPMQGHYYLRMGNRILDPICASCVIIDDGSNAIVIVSCDLSGISEADALDVRNMISEKTGISAKSILITATHTHQAPIMIDDDKDVIPWCRRDEKKHRKLLDGIVSSAQEAYRNRIPARMGYGRGEVEKCGFNRRYIMSDGKSMMNPFGKDNPDRLMVEGPVDKEVQVVWFEDMSGELISVMVNHACHPVTLIDSLMVSADFPGEMRNIIKTVFDRNIQIGRAHV